MSYTPQQSLQYFATTIANEDLNVNIDDLPKETRCNCVDITKHFLGRSIGLLLLLYELLEGLLHLLDLLR